MRKIWLMLVALCLAGPLLAAAGAGDARAQAPAVTPEDRVLGKAEAPITIFEYASLTCPHCADFEAQTLPEIKKQWIETGKARLIYRDFPFDQAALHAAVLARCAPPDRFFAFLDVLFKEQADWAAAKDPTEALKRIGKLGGVGADQFDACMKDEKLVNRIVAERLAAEKQYGVDSTPTFFINGKKLVGAQPYADFVKALQEALPKS